MLPTPPRSTLFPYTTLFRSELAKLGNRKRQDQALQALREYVDHAGGDGGYSRLCMYLAATPEMFESEHYFPRYDALRSEEHTSELQSHVNLVCRLLLEKKKK